MHPFIILYVLTFQFWDVLLNFFCTAMAMHGHSQYHYLRIEQEEDINYSPNKLYNIMIIIKAVIFIFARWMKNVKEKRRLTLGFNWKANVCFPSTRSLSLSLRSLPLSIKGLLSNSSSSNSMELTQKQVFEQEGRHNLSNIQPSFPISTFYYYQYHTLKSDELNRLLTKYKTYSLLWSLIEEAKNNEPKCTEPNEFYPK